ncbi:MAG TPA: ParB/RepB/Spo0J family partition protein [Anaerolineales bacterium]|nr:ParB/RepB/Spo0J family partition protein [Anaerolineales bacterium]
MPRKSGLGKGLEALIPADEVIAASRSVSQIPVSKVQGNPRQPRLRMDREELKGLAESIQQHGVLQPILVTATTDSEGYRLIAGDRRLQAARLVGLESVPAIVLAVDERGSLELALIENLQRVDLNPLEAAEGYRQLSEDFGMTHEEIAARVNKSRSAISNALRLLNLPPAIRQALAEGQISEGHARALLGLPTAQAQGSALQAILRRALNVRQTEELVRGILGQRRSSQAHRQRPPEEAALEDRLREHLGTRVTLRRGRSGGSLVIRFFSDEELNALIDRLLGESAGS